MRVSSRGGECGWYEWEVIGESDVGVCVCVFYFFFFKQKTAYEIGTGDWSSDVCSSDLKNNLFSDQCYQGECRED